MKPQELIQRRELTAAQIANLRMTPYENTGTVGNLDAVGGDRFNNGYALNEGGFSGLFNDGARIGIATLIRRAIAFWWEDAMLRLAIDSPLPKGYTVPEPPYPNCWFAFRGTDDDAWGSVLVTDDPNFPLLSLVPKTEFTHRFPLYDEQTFPHRLLIFLASPYVTTEYRKPHGKAALRRTQHEGVHFVTLRQPKSNPKAALKESTAIEWSARWMVRGHYRNQWYPSDVSHRTIWVASYIKGPADKPIREPVYRVAR